MRCHGRPLVGPRRCFRRIVHATFHSRRGMTSKYWWLSSPPPAAELQVLPMLPAARRSKRSLMMTADLQTVVVEAPPRGIQQRTSKGRQRRRQPCRAVAEKPARGKRLASGRHACKCVEGETLRTFTRARAFLRHRISNCRQFRLLRIPDPILE